MADTIENILPGDEASGPHRRRRRYRYKYKKKRSKKRKIKKYLEYLLWIVVIAAFISSLIILIKQMEITDEKAKKRKKKSELFIPSQNVQVCILNSSCIFSQNNFT